MEWRIFSRGEFASIWSQNWKSGACCVLQPREIPVSNGRRFTCTLRVIVRLQLQATRHQWMMDGVGVPSHGRRLDSIDRSKGAAGSPVSCPASAAARLLPLRPNKASWSSRKTRRFMSDQMPCLSVSAGLVWRGRKMPVAPSGRCSNGRPPAAASCLRSSRVVIAVLEYSLDKLVVLASKKS